MKRIILVLFLLPLVQSNAQQSILLDSCVVWAKANYPLIKQNQLFDQLQGLLNLLVLHGLQLISCRLEGYASLLILLAGYRGGYLRHE